MTNSTQIAWVSISTNQAMELVMQITCITDSFVARELVQELRLQEVESTVPFLNNQGVQTFYPGS